MMMQPDDLSIIRKMLDGILDFVANVVLNILVEVVMEGLIYLIGICIEFVLNLLFSLLV